MVKKISLVLLVLFSFFVSVPVSFAALTTYKCTSPPNRLTYQSVDCYVALTFLELPVHNGTTVILVPGQTASVAGTVNKNYIVNSSLVFVEVTDFSILVPTANQLLGVTSAGTASEMKSFLGTANQVIITNGVGSITASLPQSINSTANPTFATVNLGSGGADFADGATYGVSGLTGGRIRYNNTVGAFQVSVQAGAFSSVGGVSSVSVVTANGLAGTVATPSTTPAITLTTSVTAGVLKGNGTAILASVAGTDYSAGTAALATGILKSTTVTGGLTIAIAADFPTLNQSTTGNAATVTTNANLTGPITSVGNATAVAAQTGTGSVFAMQVSPVFTTPTIGVASGTSLSLSGALTVTGDNANPVKIAKSTVAVSAPGAGSGSFRFEAGTVTGTLKLVAYAGTGTTGTVLADNIGTGN